MNGDKVEKMNKDDRKALPKIAEEFVTPENESENAEEPNPSFRTDAPLAADMDANIERLSQELQSSVSGRAITLKMSNSSKTKFQ